MASNKRLLKKEIRNICGALAGECVIAKITVPGINPETINSIIYELAELQENALKRVSVSFPQSPKGFENAKSYKEARAKYFKAAFTSLKSEFNKHVEAIVKKMNAALPQEQKDANKNALNDK
ncbi:MAG: hypothetical protein K2O30_10735 [Duncaniella sp.]|nr:hypothetical protein [Duncaniella sp.]MDE7146604.1 hypothetical protein [Duncaniella sp.]